MAKKTKQQKLQSKYLKHQKSLNSADYATMPFDDLVQLAEQGADILNRIEAGGAKALNPEQIKTALQSQYNVSSALTKRASEMIKGVTAAKLPPAIQAQMQDQLKYAMSAATDIHRTETARLDRDSGVALMDSYDVLFFHDAYQDNENALKKEHKNLKRFKKDIIKHKKRAQKKQDARDLKALKKTLKKAAKTLKNMEKATPEPRESLESYDEFMNGDAHDNTPVDGLLGIEVEPDTPSIDETNTTSVGFNFYTSSTTADSYPQEEPIAKGVEEPVAEDEYEFTGEVPDDFESSGNGEGVVVWDVQPKSEQEKEPEPEIKSEPEPEPEPKPKLEPEVEVAAKAEVEIKSEQELEKEPKPEGKYDSMFTGETPTNNSNAALEKPDDVADNAPESLNEDNTPPQAPVDDTPQVTAKDDSPRKETDENSNDQIQDVKTFEQRLKAYLAEATSPECAEQLRKETFAFTGDYAETLRAEVAQLLIFLAEHKDIDDVSLVIQNLDGENKIPGVLKTNLFDDFMEINGRLDYVNVRLRTKTHRTHPPVFNFNDFEYYQGEYDKLLGDKSLQDVINSGDKKLLLDCQYYLNGFTAYEQAQSERFEEKIKIIEQANNDGGDFDEDLGRYKAWLGSCKEFHVVHVADLNKVNAKLHEMGVIEKPEIKVVKAPAADITPPSQDVDPPSAYVYDEHAIESKEKYAQKHNKFIKMYGARINTTMNKTRNIKYLENLKNDVTDLIDYAQNFEPDLNAEEDVVHADYLAKVMKAGTYHTALEGIEKRIDTVKNKKSFWEKFVEPSLNKIRTITSMGPKNKDNVSKPSVEEVILHEDPVDGVDSKNNGNKVAQGGLDQSDLTINKKFATANAPNPQEDPSRFMPPRPESAEASVEDPLEHHPT